MGIASRGNDGIITFRDWHPVAAEEYGYVVADPLDNNIIYGGKITRYDKRTGQAQNIAPEAVRSGKYRFLRTAPVLFNPIDKKTLYYAGNVLFKTNNGGNSWNIISPDLSRDSVDIVKNIPDNIGIYSNDEIKKMKRRGVIYTVAPSYIDINTIWCGTDDGLIHVTKDGGKTWRNVTPPQLTPWSKVSLMDAGHCDANTAYAAVNKIRLDDMKPHIYKTNNGGKTWIEIVKGLPNDPINVVKEDPIRKGLLFAGSERAVYVSFDAGANWQSLRLNMPATSVRDLVIKDDDLVIGTHGRSFWILDDITPLRQLSNQVMNQSTVLYKPQNAYRVRWNMYPDTPMPQEEPAGQNPPDGAVINYYLSENVKNISLEILDAKNNVVRKYSSMDTMYKIGDVNIPHYWIRPQQILSGEAGNHRFMWDIHYTPLNVAPSYPISATYMNTAPEATSPWVMPGKYTAKIVVGGDSKEYAQTFEVKPDPRVKTTVKDLQLQHDLSLMCYNNIKICMEKLESLNENAEPAKTLNTYINKFTAIHNVLQESDWPPTTQMINAAEETAVAFKQFYNSLK